MPDPSVAGSGYILTFGPSIRARFPHIKLDFLSHLVSVGDWVIPVRWCQAVRCLARDCKVLSSAKMQLSQGCDECKQCKVPDLAVARAG